MTRERKLAIQMWEEVKKRLPEWYAESQGYVVADLKCFKTDFCDKNNLYWKYDCWFCQYFRVECDKCPLQSCNHENPLTAWYRIVDEVTSLETKIAACDEIIMALKGGMDDTRMVYNVLSKRSS